MQLTKSCLQFLLTFREFGNAPVLSRLPRYVVGHTGSIALADCALAHRRNNAGFAETAETFSAAFDLIIRHDPGMAGWITRNLRALVNLELTQDHRGQYVFTGRTIFCDLSKFAPLPDGRVDVEHIAGVIVYYAAYGRLLVTTSRLDAKARQRADHVCLRRYHRFLAKLDRA